MGLYQGALAVLPKYLLDPTENSFADRKRRIGHQLRTTNITAYYCYSVRQKVHRRLFCHKVSSNSKNFFYNTFTEMPIVKRTR